jgi:hypothetical protein
MNAIKYVRISFRIRGDIREYVYNIIVILRNGALNPV